MEKPAQRIILENMISAGRIFLTEVNNRSLPFDFKPGKIGFHTAVFGKTPLLTDSSRKRTT